MQDRRYIFVTIFNQRVQNINWSWMSIPKSLAHNNVTGRNSPFFSADFSLATYDGRDQNSL